MLMFKLLINHFCIITRYPDTSNSTKSLHIFLQIYWDQRVYKFIIHVKSYQSNPHFTHESAAEEKSTTLSGRSPIDELWCWQSNQFFLSWLNIFQAILRTDRFLNNHWKFIKHLQMTIQIKCKIIKVTKCIIGMSINNTLLQILLMCKRILYKSLSVTVLAL